MVNNYLSNQAQNIEKEITGKGIEEKAQPRVKISHFFASEIFFNLHKNAFMHTK